MLVDKDLSDKHILKNAHVYATSVTSYKGKYSENIPMFKAKKSVLSSQEGERREKLANVEKCIYKILFKSFYLDAAIHFYSYLNICLFPYTLFALMCS